MKHIIFLVLILGCCCSMLYADTIDNAKTPIRSGAIYTYTSGPFYLKYRVSTSARLAESGIDNAYINKRIFFNEYKPGYHIVFYRYMNADKKKLLISFRFKDNKEDISVDYPKNNVFVTERILNNWDKIEIYYNNFTNLSLGDAYQGMSGEILGMGISSTGIIFDKTMKYYLSPITIHREIFFPSYYRFPSSDFSFSPVIKTQETTNIKIDDFENKNNWQLSGKNILTSMSLSKQDPSAKSKYLKINFDFTNSQADSYLSLYKSIKTDTYKRPVAIKFKMKKSSSHTIVFNFADNNGMIIQRKTNPKSHEWQDITININNPYVYMVSSAFPPREFYFKKLTDIYLTIDMSNTFDTKGTLLLDDIEIIYSKKSLTSENQDHITSFTIDDFENGNQWKLLKNNVFAGMKLSNQDPDAKSKYLKLNFDFSGSPAGSSLSLHDSIGILKGKRPTAIKFKMKQTNNCDITFKLTDASGIIIQKKVVLSKPKLQKWQEVTIQISNRDFLLNYHPKYKYFERLTDLDIIIGMPNTLNKQGTILFDDIRLIYGNLYKDIIKTNTSNFNIAATSPITDNKYSSNTDRDNLISIKHKHKLVNNNIEYQFNIINESGKNISADAKYLITDFNGNKVKSYDKKINLKSNRKITSIKISQNMADHNFLEGNFTLKANGKTYRCQKIITVRPVKNIPNPKININSKFGMGLGLNKTTDYNKIREIVKTAKDAGVKWTREEFNLYLSNNWKHSDMVVKTANNAGINICGILTYHIGDSPNNPPQNKAEYYKSVKAIVSRYKGKIKYWEIKHEDDSNQIYLSKDDYYVKLKANYALVLRDTYKTIKQIDPSIKVLCCLPNNDNYLLNEYIKKGKFFDIYTAHEGRAFTDDRSLKNRIKSDVNFIKKAGVKHIWIINCVGPNNSAIDVKDQANNLVRDYVEIFSIKEIDNFNKYDLSTDNFMAKESLRSKPIYRAYRMLTDRLEGAKFQKELKFDSNNITAYKFSGKPIIILWSDIDRVYKVNKGIKITNVMGEPIKIHLGRRISLKANTPIFITGNIDNLSLIEAATIFMAP